MKTLEVNCSFRLQKDRWALQREIEEYFRRSPPQPDREALAMNISSDGEHLEISYNPVVLTGERPSVFVAVMKENDASPEDVLAVVHDKKYGWMIYLYREENVLYERCAPQAAKAIQRDMCEPPHPK